MTPAIKQVLDEVEGALARAYRFDITGSASDFLLSEDFAARHAPDQRAAVLVYQDKAEDELQLGLYLCKDIVAQICVHNPIDGLSIDNLDAFCVLVEELSHFHLLANRALQKQTVSRLELEWQGEIDKVLVAGLFLLRQRGTPCFPQLAHLIFDRSSLLGQEAELYEEAVRFAAQHWYRLLQEVKGMRAKEQWTKATERFQVTYHLPWQAKLVSLRSR